MAPASNEISHNIKEKKLKLNDSEALDCLAILYCDRTTIKILNRI